eukprot:GHVN01063046.1.p1 GENE.GHVN01063046.1~~GHVN01063046.1.p1  ORF type:complete len:278 (+),score=16.60 GHVN01063046.1:298-1131(+)
MFSALSKIRYAKKACFHRSRFQTPFFFQKIPWRYSLPLHPCMPSHQSLLNWALENSDPGTFNEIKKKEGLDSEMVANILGRSDAVLMKERIFFAANRENGTKEREEALIALEELVEKIDNARDFGKIGGWKLLIPLFEENGAVSRLAWSVAGTSLQNDEETQTSFLADIAIGKIKSSLLLEKEPKTKAKIFKCLSSLLKNIKSISEFISDHGEAVFQDLAINFKSDTVLVERLAFFIRFSVEAGAEPALFAQTLSSFKETYFSMESENLLFCKNIRL